MTERIAIDLREGRFHRHGLIGWWNQDRLAESVALVLGAGALGNEIVKNLCLLGVGHIRIVDMDVVENSNLSRSTLFRESHEGMPKAQAAALAAKDLYPQVKITWHQLDLVHEFGWGHYADADIVLAGLDGREARLDVNRACIRVGKMFFDGAIESISGVARVFDGRTGPCYECTMGERDWELMRHRRSCNLLTREEMSHGHTPTVSTIASIIAGMQVQQAVKHLHGLDVQAGSGLSVNGISFDAWQVHYKANEECYAHEPATEIVRMPWSTTRATAAEVMAEATRRLGGSVSLELRHDIMTRRECPKCNHVDEPLKPLAKLGQGAGLCARCGEQARWETSARIEQGSSLASRTLAELGIPPYDVVRLRSGLNTFDAVLNSDKNEAWVS